MPNDSSDKALAYPKITPEYLESLIVSEEYFHSKAARTTIIVVVLDDGFAESESAVCGNPNLYDEKKGREKAKQKLLAKLMDKEYYAMRRFIHKAKQSEGLSHG